MMILLVLLGIFAQPVAFGGGNCGAANSWSRNEVEHLRKIVTGTDAGSIKARAAFQLPHVLTLPAVEHVLDEAECGRAAAALEGLYSDGRSRRPVWVFRIGDTRFAVSDLSGGGRGNILVHLFDASYKYIVSVD